MNGPGERKLAGEVVAASRAALLNWWSLTNNIYFACNKVATQIHFTKIKALTRIQKKSQNRIAKKNQTLAASISD